MGAAFDVVEYRVALVRAQLTLEQSHQSFTAGTGIHL
jgi:hypothetical protein